MPSPTNRRLAAGVLIVAIGAAAAFSGSARFSFVYDDRWTIVENRFLEYPLARLLSACAAGTAHAAGVPDATRPSMIASLWLDRRLFGLAAAPYHVHSLLLYAAAAAAATAAAFALCRNQIIALLAGLFFALAPVHAEAVAAVNYREDLIAGLGVLVAVAWLFWPTFDDSTIGAVSIATVWLWALLGKESALALLPLVVALAAVLRLGRDFWRSRELALFVLASAGILWFSWRAALTIGDDGIPRAARAAWSTSLYDTSRFVSRSVWTALWPFVWAPEYPASSPASPVWLLSVAVMALAIVLLGRRPETRIVAAGLTVAAVSPLVASPLFAPVNPWADRYLFVAVLGGGLVWGTLGERIARALPRALRGPSLVAACAGAAVFCHRSESVWASERAVWTAGVARAPGSPRAWAALSRVERLDGNLAAADRDVTRALQLDPGYTPARVTLTYDLLAHGDVVGARREIERLERVGAGDNPALPRARACAAGRAEDAPRCIELGR